MDDEDSWDQHNVASLASNPIPPRKQQQRLSLGPAAKEEEDLFHLPGHLAEAAKKGSVALLAAAAAEVDHDDDDDDDDDGMTTIGLTPSALPVPLMPEHRVRKLLSETERSAAATHKVDKDVDADEVDVDATIAITVAKAVAEEARKGKEAQTRALAAQGAQAARLHKEKLQEALQAQHAALYEQMLQGTLPPPRQATWSEALTDVLPGAKSLFDIFGAETHSQAGSQFRSQARSHRVNEAATVVPAASAQWQQEKAALEARLRLAEERAKVAEAKAESSALALIEARGRQTVAASRASVAQLALNTALREAQGGGNGGESALLSAPLAYAHTSYAGIISSSKTITKTTSASPPSPISAPNAALPAHRHLSSALPRQPKAASQYAVSQPFSERPSAQHTSSPLKNTSSCTSSCTSSSSMHSQPSQQLSTYGMAALHTDFVSDFEHGRSRSSSRPHGASAAPHEDELESPPADELDDELPASSGLSLADLLADMEEKTMKAAGLSPPAGIKHLVGVDVGVAVLLPGMRTQLDEAPVMAPVAMLASGSTTDETTDELAGEGRELTMDRNLAAARSIADIDW